LPFMWKRIQAMSLTLKWTNAKTARFACENWHYSKTIPVSKSAYIGVWEQDRFVGVVIFSHGACLSIGNQYKLDRNEIVELTRVALRAHKNKTSKIISIAIRLIRSKFKKIRMLVSYADTNENHTGIIYQATNWVYVGETSPELLYKRPDGRIVHSRVVSKTGLINNFGKIERCYRTSDCEKVATKSKHKYLYPLDKQMARQIEPLRLPYPKRAGSIGSDAPGDQPGEGGASPTSALQSKKAKK